MKTKTKKGFYILAALVMSFAISCNDDDLDVDTIDGLEFVTATLNVEGTKIGVVPSTVNSNNRIVYTVDFGATDDDTDVFQTSGPMVTYEYPNEDGTYTITINSSLEGTDDVSISKMITIKKYVDPNRANPFVGTWKLAPEAGALGVGPARDDVSWWSSDATTVADRACLFDDEYVFNADGTFSNNVGADTWLEPWQGTDPEACGAPVFPHDGTATATYEWDENAGTVTINGKGAFLGLAKVFNLGELTSPADAVDSITYIYTITGNTMELDIEVAGGGFWSFKLTTDAQPPVTSSLAGVWKLAPEAGALGVGPAKDNVSWWSSDEATVTDRACLFDDEYVFNEDGTFSNNVGSETWLEPWQGIDPEACGAPIAPHDGTASATYTHDATAGTITINGKGAFLGLAKVFNGGELTNPADAPDSITYIAVITGDTMELDIEVAGGGFWSFRLKKDGPASPVGTWKLAPEAGALGVGPAKDNVSWWSSDETTVTDRACLFDDEYVFNADGTFMNIVGSETWLEPWQGVDPEACGAPIAPHDGTASATYTYDATAGTITINGKGAFLGLAKVFNLGELAAPADAPDDITYIAVINGDTMDLDIEVGGGGYWTFKLARQ